MRKEFGLVFLFLVFLAFFSVLANVVGTSTGGDVRDRLTTSVQNANTDSERVSAMRDAFIQKRDELKESYRERKCEEIDSVRERIACRLSRGEEYRAPPDTVPEACKRLSNPTACIALYRQARACYDQDSASKERCLKKASGFVRSQLADEAPEQRREKARNYLITLLYDLQERVEKMNADGNIDPDKAVEIINKIVEIKQNILDEKPRSEIVPLLNELKQMWRGAVSEIGLGAEGE